MATYYVFSGAAGSNNGSSWTNAYTTFGAAVTAATVDGDEILIHNTHAENLSANTTYTFAADVRCFCVNKDSSDALSSMGNTGTYYIGNNSTTARNITMAGTNKRVFFQGIQFSLASSASFTCSGNGLEAIFKNCTIYFTSNGTGSINLGGSGELNNYEKLIDCEIVVTSTSSSIRIGDGKAMLDNLKVSGNMGTVFTFQEHGPLTEVFNCDFSSCTGNLAADSDSGHHEIIFSNCKMGSGFTALANQTITNKSSISVSLFNCSSGDQHYHMQHHDALGSTLVDTGIYANDGASYDGTNRCSWKIVTTAATTRYSPYISPWIDVYHTGTSAITPYLEIVRSGSSTPYTNADVWVEFSYQGTSGSTKGSTAEDNATSRSTPANQTSSSLGAGDWTGENATSWFGKLAPNSSITPVEIGHIRARVWVGAASATVYVDPQIRGLS